MPTKPADTPIRRAVAELIREATAGKTTQAQLAETAGVRQSLLSSILTGARADLRADTVARIARACGLSERSLGGLLYGAINAEKTPKKNSGS